MENDYSKLLPVLFNGKDYDRLAFTQDFFTQFSDECFTGNPWGETYLGFVENQEVRRHYVANRVSVKFSCRVPSKDLITRIKNWLPEKNNPGIISSVWEESDSEIVAQYYWKEDV